jgi:hypothetical protein
MSNEKEVTLIKVPSEGGERKDGDEPMLTPGPNPEAGGKKVAELVSPFAFVLSLLCTEALVRAAWGSQCVQSAEDRELQERLELAVERLKDTSTEVQLLALELLRSEVRGATRWVTTEPRAASCVPL